ncbi:MAG: hypothetical protein ACTSSG_05830 [Candidatus Heimdallarchaeaceae archaeon]
MTEVPISVEELIKQYNLQPHDLEYILNFMKKENISPQLAMRRIKLFEKLQEKMEQAQSDDKVKELTSELDHLSKVVEDLQAERDALQQEKEKLDKEIEDTRLQQDLFNAEREELKMQMHALMSSIESIETEAEEGEEKLQVENQELKKKVSVMESACRTLKDKLEKLSSQNPSLKNFVKNLTTSLSSIIEGQQLPANVVFNVPSELIVSSSKVSTKPSSPQVEQVMTATETISPDQIKFVTPSKIPESKLVAEKTIKKEEVPPAAPTVTEEKKKPSILAPSAASTPKRKPVIKEKIFAEPEELETETVQKEEKKVSMQEPKRETATIATEITKPKPRKEEKPKKIDVSAKPQGEGKQVSPKIEKILRLFISYAQAADNDENWKARIAAICDMDEAYIELGGLAMSQIYSYQTQSIKKKKEFERLLNSWIENGLPR